MPTGFEILHEHLRDQVGFHVVFDRNKNDEFFLEIGHLKEPKKSFDPPSKSQLLEFLPQGSNWSRVVGWRSFFGIPYRYEDRTCLALGLVKILEHDHRGAFPRCEIFLIDFQSDDLGDRLGRIGSRINEGTMEDETIPRYGALIGEANEPAEHREMEGRILRGAAAAYSEGSTLLFRTAVLTENEIPDSRFFRFFSGESTGELSILFSRALYGTVPPIYKNFRWSSKLQVFLERSRTF